MKKILLVEPDSEQADSFADWLKQEGYAVKTLNKLKDVYSSVSEEKFDILLIDIDYPEITEASIELCRTLKKNSAYQDLHIVFLTYRKDGKRIARSIDSGVDSFVLKPFEIDSFLERIKSLFKELELKHLGKHVVNLHYINFLIKLSGEISRNDFFLIAPVIFNRLIVDKIKPVIGNQVIMVMIRRAKELVSEQYPFMTAVELSDGKLLMDGVDKDSMGVSIEILTTAFRDYVYAFMHLVRMLTSTILIDREKGC